jgi:hypothetical protein
MRLMTALLLCAASGAACAAEMVSAPQPPCADPPSRQFDFWLGDWDVFDPAGKQVGTNRISLVYGCVLHESWKATKVVEGQSFNRYDADRGLWHQTWVDSMGSLLLLEGGLKDGAMVLSDATTPGRKAEAPLNEIRWTKNPDGSVRQLWLASADGGKTWKTEFDGKYVRSARPQPR